MRKYEGHISGNFMRTERAGAFRTDEQLGPDGTRATLIVYDREPRVKTVYQWRYKNEEQRHWKVAKSLLSKDEAEEYFIGCEIEEHAGPFRVSK